MNKITNRQVICDTLMEAAKTDRDIMVLCSDSRGSASLTPFAKAYPEQFIEVGIPAAAVSVIGFVILSICAGIYMVLSLKGEEADQ